MQLRNIILYFSLLKFVCFKMFKKGESVELSEWLSDCCLTLSEHFSAIWWREHVTFRWDDDVCFVQDQSTYGCIFITWTTVHMWTFRSTLTHYPDSEPARPWSYSRITGPCRLSTYVAIQAYIHKHGHVHEYCMLNREAINTNALVFGLTNYLPNKIEENMVTITSPMCLRWGCIWFQTWDDGPMNVIGNRKN